MIEAEWLTCSDPTPMLEFLWGKVSDRKFRLFACACCRRVWHLLGDTNSSSRTAVEMAERFADGEVAQKRLNNAAYAAEAGPVSGPPGAKEAACAALFAAATDSYAEPGYWSAYHSPPRAADAIALYSAADQPTFALEAARKAELAAQCRLLQDMIGPTPFRLVALESTWLAGSFSSVVQLAQTIYDDRLFDHLPILADALEDAGCGNADILNHCRHQGEHVRGCWVMDLLLGKK